MNATKDPLHGVTLEHIVTALQTHYGWEALGRLIDIKCFNQDPSIKSSLKFLRRTPWARSKVETLYCKVVESAEKGTVKRPISTYAKTSRPSDEAVTAPIEPAAKKVRLDQPPAAVSEPVPAPEKETTDLKPRVIPSKWKSFT